MEKTAVNMTINGINQMYFKYEKLKQLIVDLFGTHSLSLKAITKSQGYHCDRYWCLVIPQIFSRYMFLQVYYMPLLQVAG